MQQSPTTRQPVRRTLIHRHADPDRRTGAIEFGVSGPNGAVSFAVQVSGTFLPGEDPGGGTPDADGVQPVISRFVDLLRATPRRHGGTVTAGPDYAIASCVAYHSPRPGGYGGQEPVDGCDFLDGRTCYGDVSFLRGNTAFAYLVTDGAAGLLDWLEADYAIRYGEEA